MAEGQAPQRGFSRVGALAEKTLSTISYRRGIGYAFRPGLSYRWGLLTAAALRKLVVPFHNGDAFPHRATLIFLQLGNYPRGGNGHWHPRRGNGQLFAKYEKILARLGLTPNLEGGDQQHVIVPADATPPRQRIYESPLELERRFGIGVADHCRVIPVNVHEREVPDWTKNDEQVRLFVMHRFPHFQERLHTGSGVRTGPTRRHPTHRKAAELAYVIYMWFRLLLPAATIAAELGLAEGHVIQRANDVREHGVKLFSPEGCDCNARRGPCRWAASRG